MDADKIFETAMDVLNRNNTEEALTLLSGAAKNGHEPSKFKIAQILMKIHQIGSERFQAGLEAMIDLADSGHSEAQFEIGFWLASRSEYSDCIKYYEQASAGGHLFAKHLLAIKYYNGYGVDKNYEKALSLLIEAAENGVSESQIFIGHMYYIGELLPTCYEKAMYWFNMAAEQGNVDAHCYLAGMLLDGEGCDKNEEGALKHYLIAAETGMPKALNGIGAIYANGRGVEKDYTEALKFYLMAASRDWAPAQYNIGAMYSSGQGVEADHLEAFYWFYRAAKNGHADANFRVYAYVSECNNESIKCRSDEFLTRAISGGSGIIEALRSMRAPKN